VVSPAASTALPIHHQRVHGRVWFVTGGQDTTDEAGLADCLDWSVAG
jgi:hypothetical protein